MHHKYNLIFSNLIIKFFIKKKTFFHLKK